MMRSNPLFIFGSIFLITSQTTLYTQEWSLEELPAVLRERAVVVDITARVIEQNRQEVWNSVNSKITIPGRPVGIKLVGANIVVAVQFTPYRQNDGRPMLVAQGQIWIDIPNEGISYQTTLETIALEYGEPIFFFPLGSATAANNSRIEIQVALYPYLDRAANEAASAQDAADAPGHTEGGIPEQRNSMPDIEPN